MTASLQALLAGAIDYAGLFPPAGLDLGAALGNYRAYQRSADAWALGRFVVPTARLTELEALLRSGDAGARAGLRVSLSALLAPADPAGIAAVQEFNRRTEEHGAKVEAVEVKVDSADAARALLAQLSTEWLRYLEVPLGPESEATLDAVRSAGGFAKVRTGGTSADTIPAPEELLGFLERAAGHRLPFKATAGLHHPLRGVYRLTYEESAPSAPLYGYLNVLLAAGILWKGGGSSLASTALLEEDPNAVRFDPYSLSWRGLQFDSAALAGMRRSFFHSFGSCSFREPLDELASGGWL